MDLNLINKINKDINATKTQYDHVSGFFNDNDFIMARRLAARKKLENVPNAYSMGLPTNVDNIVIHGESELTNQTEEDIAKEMQKSDANRSKRKNVKELNLLFKRINERKPGAFPQEIIWPEKYKLEN